MKLNKKGFTLAELLIVIAIIAVLIAIAIPTFAGALENARRQTDHANIRAAYSMLQVAKMEGGIPQDDGSVDKPTGTSDYWTFQKDGSLVRGTGFSPYQLKAHGNDSCLDCAGCPGVLSHNPNTEITIQYGATGWQLVLVTPAGP